MKRLLSLALVLAMVLSFGVCAFAADGDPTPVAPEAITIKKTYTATNGSALTVCPTETLEFEVKSAKPDGDTLTYPTEMPKVESKKVTGDETELEVTFPEYSEIGKYYYTITEKAGSTQGVGYDTTTEIQIEVLVTWNVDETTGKSNGTLNAVAGLVDQEGVGKVGTIKNTFKTTPGDDPENPQDPEGDDPSLHGLVIEKSVVGDAVIDPDHKFDFTIELTAQDGYTVTSNIYYYVAGERGVLEAGKDGWTGSKTITGSIADGERIVVDFIPEGVSYTVREDSKYQAADTSGSGTDDDAGWTVLYSANAGGKLTKTTYTVGEGDDAVTYDQLSGTAQDQKSESGTVTNEKQGTPGTGVALDTIPYIALMLIATAGLAVVLTKKRHSEN